MRKGDARWSNISAAGGANAGTAAMGLAGSLFGKALQTAEDGLTKHQEELEKNVASEKAANTALILKMKSEGKPVSKDFMKQLGVYDGAEINEGSMKLRAEQQDRLMNNHRMSMDNQRFAQTKLKDAAQIANWNAQKGTHTSYSDRAKIDIAKAAQMAKLGLSPTGRALTSKKGSKGYKPKDMTLSERKSTEDYLTESLEMDNSDARFATDNMARMRAAGVDQNEYLEFLNESNSGSWFPWTDADMAGGGDFLGFGTNEDQHLKMFMDWKKNKDAGVSSGNQPTP